VAWYFSDLVYQDLLFILASTYISSVHEDKYMDVHILKIIEKKLLHVTLILYKIELHSLIIPDNI